MPKMQRQKCSRNPIQLFIERKIYGHTRSAASSIALNLISFAWQAWIFIFLHPNHEHTHSLLLIDWPSTPALVAALFMARAQSTFQTRQYRIRLIENRFFIYLFTSSSNAIIINGRRRKWGMKWRISPIIIERSNGEKFLFLMCRRA